MVACSYSKVGTPVSPFECRSNNMDYVERVSRHPSMNITYAKTVYIMYENLCFSTKLI